MGKKSAVRSINQCQMNDISPVYSCFVYHLLTVSHAFCKSLQTESEMIEFLDVSVVDLYKGVFNVGSPAPNNFSIGFRHLNFFCNVFNSLIFPP